jgi:hypothetical protein
MSEFSQAVLALAIYRLIPILLGLAFACLGYYLLRLAFSTGTSVAYTGFTDRIFSAAFGTAILGLLFAGFGACVIKKNLGWMENDIGRIYALVPPPLEQRILAIIKQASDGENLDAHRREILKQWLQEIDNKRAYRLQKAPQPPQNPGKTP